MRSVVRRINRKKAGATSVALSNSCVHTSGVNTLCCLRNSTPSSSSTSSISLAKAGVRIWPSQRIHCSASSFSLADSASILAFL